MTMFGSEPHDGQIFIAERSRKGSRKLLWLVMSEAPIAADAGIAGWRVPIRKAAAAPICLYV
jgi:hypothetical protein